MPCKTCHKFFRHKPCEKYKQNRKIKRIIKECYSNCTTGYTNKLLNKYQSLTIGCPCEECLVKIMCNEECLSYSIATENCNIISERIK